MKKVLGLLVASSLLSASAMAVGPTKEVNCKDVVKRIKAIQDQKSEAKTGGTDNGAPVKGDEKDAK